jgi:hypothetical protein
VAQFARAKLKEAFSELTPSLGKTAQPVSKRADGHALSTAAGALEAHAKDIAKLGAQGGFKAQAEQRALGDGRVFSPTGARIMELVPGANPGVPMDQAAAPPVPPQFRTDGPYLNADTHLGPVRGAFNNARLSVAQRVELMLEYRNEQLAGFATDPKALAAMLAMKGNSPTLPLYGSGETKGSHHALIDKLRGDSKMQALVGDLAARINSTDPRLLNIHTLWQGTFARAARLYDPLSNDTSESRLRALQAMATVFNQSRFDGNPGLDARLWTAMQGAGHRVDSSLSPSAAVMSHGAAAIPHPAVAGGTADRNYHFFTHAYLTASLMREHGMSESSALAISGFIGAHYELLSQSVRENSGNDGVKDILLNAEGAAFGQACAAGIRAELPDQNDGPRLEERFSESFPMLEKLPQDAMALIKSAEDLSPAQLAWCLMQAVMPFYGLLKPSAHHA